MQKILKRSIISVIICLFFVLIIGVAALSVHKKSDIPPSTATETVPKYKFSVYENRLALFENGDTMPAEIFDTYIEDLPPTEQVRIAAGIFADTEAEIQQIIEDYTS